ncbi:MAG: protein kinase, partial [Planctomyces sp.]|nr:protein kinase [Planctomyces sp.]
MPESFIEDGAIFNTLRRLATEQERLEHLENALPGDHDRQARILQLLAAHERNSRSLETVTVASREEATQLPAPLNATIGPYRLEAVLGQGGMGVVYLAAQEWPIRRQVALKVIRSGLAVGKFLQRFNAERQALAMMSHEGIARVFDAGTTDAGLPYFVMEYIDGAAITRECDARQLSIRQRLKLFIRLCEAVQHAHQKGLIHRDLKPSNILLQNVSGCLQPCVIDFGVAKAFSNPLLTEESLTQHGQMVGTIEYMAPEQFLFDSRQVDTRADIYALGVILCELLTGDLPHGRDRLRSCSLLNVIQIVNTEVPRLPSRRALSPEIAAARTLSVRQLSRDLHGNIDSIVLKALSHSPDDRYSSVSELANDVRHHLEGVPIGARRPRALERVIRQAKRHWLAASLSVLAVLATAAFVIDRQIQSQALAALLFDRESRLYASDVQRAAGAWSSGQFKLFQDIVARYADGQSSAAVRGVEWNLLNGRTRRDGSVLANNIGDVYCGVYSPDGRSIAIVGQDARVRILDAETGELIHAWATGQGETNCAAFSADGEFVWTAGDDGTLKKWEIATGKCLWSTEAHPGEQAFKVLFDSRRDALFTCGTGSEIRIWNAEDGLSRGVLLGHAAPIQSIAINAGTPMLASASDDGTARVWNLDSGLEVQRIEVRYKASGVAFSANGEYLAVLERDHRSGGAISIIRPDTGERIVSRDLHEPPVDACFDPKRRMLVVITTQGHAVLFRLAIHRKESRDNIPVPIEPVSIWESGLTRGYGICRSPDHNSALLVGAGGPVTKWSRPWEAVGHFDHRAGFYARHLSYITKSDWLMGAPNRGLAWLNCTGRP